MIAVLQLIDGGCRMEGITHLFKEKGQVKYSSSTKSTAANKVNTKHKKQFQTLRSLIEKEKL